MASFITKACLFPPTSTAFPNINFNNTNSHKVDANFIKRAVELADKSAGISAPHPNFGCVIIEAGRIVGEAYLHAEGATPAEVQAVKAGREWCRGATAYLNMEPAYIHGDHTAVSALIQARIKRVVIGIRNPLEHMKGKAIQALRSEGIHVDVLGEDLHGDMVEKALKSCLEVNAPLIVRATSKIPYSVLKYAMTLDGKIATNKGDSKWVSSNISRDRVFQLRARSDAIIIGGNTVRKDNPILSTRQEGGHFPARIVMSQSLNLPEDAQLWDTSKYETIVVAQKGARRSFQKYLASKGVEVVEFEVLNLRDVMEYFYRCGYLSLLWECGGRLAAPAISSRLIHKVYAFIAPKIIGGKGAPSPVSELGMIQMTQAFNLHDVHYEQVGPDMVVGGFLQPIPNLIPTIPSLSEKTKMELSVSPTESSNNIISFYKTWDAYGCFSNFSSHPIKLPDEGGNYSIWSSVEHYYQAHKFYGVQDQIARDCFETIKSSNSPEKAAIIGRKLQKQRPDLVRDDWESAKADVMYRALKCKFSTYPHLKSILLSTGGSILVEGSQKDLFWGCGRDGNGLNYLGRLLMQLRLEFSNNS
ncbi:riboflavin biosynthesis protein PYRR, chloroplastic-like [Amaranthus tricolor]|uniref:riboflavin biosynthesis protein PYRR, chloroplastic-like n=1 Tax=Amaranthus tricolor TaxID=29722 RepID=UPI00258968E6|nr:riboflavin biosynthesis protein PYRR, chloroplastic-like [Amaranthus tricolor]